MTITLLAGIGALVCLVMLGALAVISQLSSHAIPDFVYLVGLALAVVVWIMLSKAGF